MSTLKVDKIKVNRIESNTANEVTFGAPIDPDGYSSNYRPGEVIQKVVYRSQNSDAHVAANSNSFLDIHLSHRTEGYHITPQSNNSIILIELSANMNYGAQGGHQLWGLDFESTNIARTVIMDYPANYTTSSPGDSTLMQPYYGWARTSLSWQPMQAIYDHDWKIGSNITFGERITYYPKYREQASSDADVTYFVHRSMLWHMVLTEIQKVE